MNRAMATLAILGLLVAGCRRDADKARGDAPPPVVSAVAGLCDSGGGKITDAVASKLLPTTVGGYCVDPHNEIRTYGREAKGTIEQVCTELFDGECEVYRQFGLERVVSVRYADGSGSPGTVVVNLSRFESGQQAFGFFTRRVLGDADPDSLTLEPLDAGALGALGSSVAYLWRGTHVAELSYSNDNESPEGLKASSKRILPLLGKGIGELLPGERTLPAVVRLLPETGRARLGLAFEPKDVLGVTGAGSGVFAYYRDGARKYRVMALERPNDQAAQDVMKTLRRVEGASEQKGPPVTIILSQRLAMDSPKDSSKVEWVVGRTGHVVLGVGDDEHSVTGASSKSDRLSTAEKTTRLTALLQDIAKRPPAGDTP